MAISDDRCFCQDRLQQVLEKSEPVTSEHIESTWAPAAITLKDMTFGFMDVEKDPLLPKDQRYGWLYGWGFSYVFTRACWELTPVPDVEWSEDISFYEELRRLKVPAGRAIRRVLPRREC